MKNGKVIAALLRQGKGGGIPWIVILTPKLAPLATSDAQSGNIGCPVTASEIAHFMQMLATTRRKMSDADLGAIRAALTENGAKIRDAQKRARDARARKRRK